MLGLVLGFGCDEQTEFTAPMVLGGQSVSPEVLNAGREAFILYCYACHGPEGKGDGPSSPGLRPPPRDFTTGILKFGGVKAGELPTDEALLKTIRLGLNGTPMLAWDIPEIERVAIVQYIKTLTPRWKNEKPGTPIEVTPDPWVGREPSAIERGKLVYHAIAQCKGCHPSYATRQDMATLSQMIGMPAPTEFPSDLDMYRASLRESSYKVGEIKMQIQPTDFLQQKVKSVRFDASGANLQDLYVTIAAGIGGTAMPVWKGNLPEPELWALVHYTKWLIDMRGTEKAAALRNVLTTQTPYVPPAPPPDPNAPPPGEPTKK